MTRERRYWLCFFIIPSLLPPPGCLGCFVTYVNFTISVFTGALLSKKLESWSDRRPVRSSVRLRRSEIPPPRRRWICRYYRSPATHDPEEAWGFCYFFSLFFLFNEQHRHLTQQVRAARPLSRLSLSVHILSFVCIYKYIWAYVYICTQRYIYARMPPSESIMHVCV